MEFEKKIAVLGSTGSIGTQTLEIAREYKGIKIEAMSAHSNIDLIEKQAREFKPKMVCLTDEEKAKDLKIKLADTDIKVVQGKEGLIETATADGADTVVTAVVGISGLEPTIEAIKAKKNIALANKETLVTGGHIVMDLAKENGVEILPVDSEHSAIFQSLQGCKDRREVKRILLTASGGPFFGKKREELVDIKPEDALKHPNWNMGAKVTIDSSTLVNKGLEVMEAKWLFGTDNIKVLVHRQSVVHSMVEFVDNGVIAQLGAPDMRLPIQYALTYPNRLPMKNNELDFTKYPSLTFDEPDTDTFYALKLAYDALKDGGIKPTVFNSADEAAVELFMKGKISYLGISDAIAKAMSEIKNIENPTISDIWETDKLAREIVYRLEKESFNLITAIVSVVMFLVMVSLHEFGHFIVAKMLNFKVDEFSVGMGPAIFKKKKGETQYSIRILPLGGYCKFEGEDEADNTDPRAFFKSKAVEKIACTFGRRGF